MTTEPETSDKPLHPAASGWPWGLGARRTVAAAALVGAFALGAGITAAAQHGRHEAFVALSPAPIAAMKEWSPVAVKGNVAEVFGNKFVIQDDSGRALVETGPQGEGGALVAQSETIVVQGRFEHGFIHAVAIQHADGRTDVVGPPGPPHRPHGPLAWLHLGAARANAAPGASTAG